MPPAIASSSFSPDVYELLVLLAAHRVRYLIVGGEAVIFHGHIRLTGDVDLFYELEEGNVRRLHAALLEFWEGAIPGVDAFAELAQPGAIIQFGRPPNRVDLLNTIDGVPFDLAWRGRSEVVVEGACSTMSISYLGLDELIVNERAAGRPKDLDDLRFLEAACARRDRGR